MCKRELYGLKVGDIITNKKVMPVYGHGLQEVGYDYKVTAIKENGVSVRVIVEQEPTLGDEYEITDENVESCLDLRIK